MAESKPDAPDPEMAVEEAQKTANIAAEAATNQSRILLLTRKEIDQIENLAKSGASEFSRVLDAVRYWHQEHEGGDPEKASELKSLLANWP